MIIKEINIRNNGHIYCKSGFYKAHDVLPETLEYSFTSGINRLCGEIDSGIWAVSYLLSMYKYREQDFVLFHEPEVIVNGKIMPIAELSQYTCYMDEIYPLFLPNESVRELVEKGINDNKSNYCANDVRKMFELDIGRFERPLSQVGNAVFRCMAAIAYSNNKEVFCFPWLSKMRFDNYHMNLTWLLDKLAELNKIVIVPIGKE